MTDATLEPAVSVPARRWWQLLLVYPSLGIALVSATPVLADKAMALYHGTNTSTYSEANSAARHVGEESGLLGEPVRLVQQPGQRQGRRFDLPLGDIFVRVMTPDQKSFYHWLPLDEIVRPDGAPGGGLVPAAKAAIANYSPAPARLRAGGRSEIRLAQLSARVICQHMVDGRILVRRIQTPQGCFDEYVDTLNGAVVRRNPAPCTPQC